MWCKPRCGDIKDVVRYEIWCDTIYKAIRDMRIYEIARYMRCWDIQNIVIKKTGDTMSGNTRYGEI